MTGVQCRTAPFVVVHSSLRGLVGPLSFASEAQIAEIQISISTSPISVSLHIVARTASDLLCSPPPCVYIPPAFFRSRPVSISPASQWHCEPGLSEPLNLELSRILDVPEGARERSTPRATSRAASSRAASPGAQPPEDSGDVGGNTPSLSCIVAIEAWKEGKVCYISSSVSEILGFEMEEIMGTPAYEFAHPEDAPQLYRAYQEMISEDKAACLLYMRVRHKDPRIGFVISSVSCSRVGGHIIGSVSIASSEAKAMHNASTAQEVKVLTPAAAHLEFRRWNAPAPTTAPTSPEHQPSSPGSTSPPSHGSSLEPSSPRNEGDDISQSLHDLSLSPPAQPAITKRVAFVLNRFSENVHIVYATNDDIVPISLVTGRSFYDFVAPGDENRIRKAIDAVKEWGVNEQGEPSDGGFAFNRFRMDLIGRDSSIRPDPALLRNRRKSHADTSSVRPYRDGRASSSHTASSPPTPTANEPFTSTPPTSRNRITERRVSERGISAPKRDTQLVDAIFSPQSDGIIVILRPALHSKMTRSPKQAPVLK